ncbi:MAG: zinc ribbon domain-containing protein [Aeromonas sp.]
MQDLCCPSCHSPLDTRSNDLICSQCQAHVSVQAVCPTCQHELERLRACGAVDYFCNHCNGLVSKRKVHFTATVRGAQV